MLPYVSLVALDRSLFPLVVVENDLAHTHRLRGDLHELVEVTPQSMRMRKIILDHDQRKKAGIRVK